MSNQGQEKKRFKPVKVKITKHLYEKLRRVRDCKMDAGLSTDEEEAIDEILRQVEEGQTAPETTAADGLSYLEFKALLVNFGVWDKVVWPTHNASAASYARFFTSMRNLQVTAEDVEKFSEQMLRWKSPMALEKLTAILPSMITEARAKTQKTEWRPRTWDTVDGTVSSENFDGTSSDF